MKKNLSALGFMSGTSGDGVDTSVISSNGKDIVNIKYNRFDPYPTILSNKIHSVKENISERQDILRYLSDIEELEILVLEDGHCFRNHVLKLCKTTTISKSFDLKSGSFETLVNLVNEGPWVTILPYLQTLKMSSVDKANLRYFKDPEPAREISIVYNKSQLKLPIIEALSNQIEGIIRGAIKFDNIQLIAPK